MSRAGLPDKSASQDEAGSGPRGDPRLGHTPNGGLGRHVGPGRWRGCVRCGGCSHDRLRIVRPGGYGQPSVRRLRSRRLRSPPTDGTPALSASRVEAASVAPTARHRSQLSWVDIASLDRGAAVSELAAQFHRHQRPAARQLLLLAAVVAGAAAAAVWVHLLVGPVIVALAGGSLFRWRRHANHRWARQQIRLDDPPTERLRVVVVMLTRSAPGDCTKQLFRQLLRTAPDQLTCAALGRHLKGYCPHATAAW